ncbi:MAG: MmcQ/YjbR family DNA-binding protein [Alphaproteobacteria bacterium]|nr:MmcQ/YjbR family DNA-binding protein [Alphaproteobacteria bacterium]
MTIEENIFKKARIDFSSLLKYGFKKEKNIWIYNKLFMNDEFRAEIKIDVAGKLTGQVLETDSNDIYYPLRVETMAVGYAGQVREEYEKILHDIKQKCCQVYYFSSPQANRLVQRIFMKYQDKPNFPWKKYQGYGVLKNPANGKWYALIANINKNKLGDKKNGEVEIINIKLHKDKIKHLLAKNGFYPAYHMNKTSWITIVLDESIQDDLICDLIEESHQFTMEDKRDNDIYKAWIVPANPKFFDIETAFKNNAEIIWKQSADIKKGDTVYIYLAAPFSAIRYKCLVTAANIPYQYQDENIKINKVMKIKSVKKYQQNIMPFAKLQRLGIKAIRGPRKCPENLANILQ